MKIKSNTDTINYRYLDMKGMLLLLKCFKAKLQSNDSKIATVSLNRTFEYLIAILRIKLYSFEEVITEYQQSGISQFVQYSEFSKLSDHLVKETDSIDRSKLLISLENQLSKGIQRLSQGLECHYSSAVK